MKFKFVILLLVLVSCNPLFAWENKKTHPAITDNSITASIADGYFKTQMGMTNGITTQLYWNFPSDIMVRISEGEAYPNQTTRSISEWLRVGSIIEDQDDHTITPPWRPRHHFYDPTRNAGLDNHTAYPEWDAPGWSDWLPLGASALDWAINGSASYEPYTNNEKWSNARSLFYSALTDPNKAVREAYLAESLLKLGCVLHLLEDMGVPAHTRNDFLYGHYRSVYTFDWGNDLEKDVETKITANGGNSLWSGSGAIAFDKLAKYFDTDTRDSEHYLGNGVLPPDTWGLSEATNYQFMSLSTVFGSYLPKYYFPHPHMAYMGTPIEVETGDDERKVYFNGVNYGVSHIARESYTYHYTKHNNIYAELTPDMQHKIDSTITTDDQMVLDDYADITIPRTIDYAAGLANYFFRGKIEASVTDYNYSGYPDYKKDNEITIKNLSKNSDLPQVLKGGSFELYWDNQDGIRSPVEGTITVKDPAGGDWSSNSVLAYNGTTTMEFTTVTLPEGQYLDKYVVVYKGGIQSDADHPDSDDNQALATTSFYCGELCIDGGTPYASSCECAPGCDMACGDLRYVVSIWNISDRSGVPQDMTGGTFEIYYVDMEGQLILLTSVTDSLDYYEWDTWEELQIDMGVIEPTPAQRLVVIYKGKMADSENPTNEYDGMAAGSRDVERIGYDDGCYCICKTGG